MKTKLAIGLLIVVAATIIFFQLQTQKQLRAEAESMAQQIAELKTDNESLSNRLAAAASSKPLSDPQKNELMKLRGEVGALRNQVGQLGKLRDENQRLRKDVMAVRPEPVPLSKQGEYEWHATNTVEAARLIGLGMIMFAGDNNNQSPTNFSQISSLIEGMTNQTSGIGAEAFELIDSASPSSQDAANKLILRERISFKTVDGKWARTYGFGDGHVEVKISDDGNFDAFEKEHLVLPPNQ